MAAPTGARRTKADHANLPVSLPEIVAEARACDAAGAEWLHLHVRDEAGRHSLDPGLYREALAELARAVPDLRVQITTEAAGRYAVADQLATLQALRPRAASIAIREIARDPALAPRIYATCREAGTDVQHILHDPSDIAQLAAWQALGFLPPSGLSVIVVLGTYAPPRPASLTDLEAFRAVMPKGVSRWMACAFGATEQDVLLAAARLGADIRIGFENNILAANGQVASGTAANVASFRAALTMSQTEEGVSR